LKLGDLATVLKTTPNWLLGVDDQHDEKTRRALEELFIGAIQAAAELAGATPLQSEDTEKLARRILDRAQSSADPRQAVKQVARFLILEFVESEPTSFLSRSDNGMAG
jgi:hypothetical protein